MPIMTGFELTQIIRSEPKLKDIPIILSSASVLDFDQQKSEQGFLSIFLRQ